MTIACYEDTRPDCRKLMRRFALGCGGKLISTPQPQWTASDHAVVAKGVAAGLVPQFRQRSLRFWYLDSAYIQIPGPRYARIERGAFWPPPPNSGYSMDRAHSIGVRLKPWRKTGSHVLLCLPGPRAGADFGIDMRKWWAEIRATLSQTTDRPIRMRHKKARVLGPPLAVDLEDAWCVVTHSSTSAVSAAIAGIPVFCEPTCAAAAVGRTDLEIESPATPDDREEWISALAWRQFSWHELRNGMAWSHVKDRP